MLSHVPPVDFRLFDISSHRSAPTCSDCKKSASRHRLPYRHRSQRSERAKLRHRRTSSTSSKPSCRTMTQFVSSRRYRRQSHPVETYHPLPEERVRSLERVSEPQSKDSDSPPYVSPNRTRSGLPSFPPARQGYSGTALLVRKRRAWDM